MPVVGSRFLIEAGFIIGVAVIAGIERLSAWWIIAVVASAWIRWTDWLRRSGVRRSAARAGANACCGYATPLG